MIFSNDDGEHMIEDKSQMFEIINDPKVLSKYSSVDIFTLQHNQFKQVKDRNERSFKTRRRSDYLNRRLFIRMEDRIAMIREKQYQLSFKLFDSLKVDVAKSKKILSSIISVTLSEPHSEVLLGLKTTIRKIVNTYLDNPDIVSYLTKICVHDYTTQQHLINVMLYCMGYAYYNGYDKEEIELYGLIGLMHDIGKISIPDYLLKAPRKLSEREWMTIKEHPINSWKILRQCNFDVRVRIAAQEHHERIDGSGYPEGKTGNDMYEASKVLAIIDVFEAMTTWRPYKKPVKPVEALQNIRKEVMKQKLDPYLFKKFAYSIVGMRSQHA